jgi:hypothetical protein
MHFDRLGKQRLGVEAELPEITASAMKVAPVSSMTP